MNIEQSIYDRLSSDSTLSALVGTRIYPTTVPDNELPTPWITYAVTDAEPWDEQLTASGDITDFQVSFAVVADYKDYATLRDIADAIQTSLHFYTGGQILESFWRHTNFGLDDSAGNLQADLTFTVRGLTAAILPSQGGLPRVEVHEDGLYFDGEQIGATGPAGADGEPGYPTPLASGQLLTNDGTTVSWGNQITDLYVTNDGVHGLYFYGATIQPNGGNITCDNLGNAGVGALGFNWFGSAPTAILDVQPNGPTHVGLKVTQPTGGTADLTQWRSSVGSTVAKITASGGLTAATITSTGAITGTTITGTQVGVNSTAPAAQLDVRTQSSGTVGQIIRGSASQTANLSVWQDSTGTDVARVKPNGDWAFVASSQENIVLSAGGGITVASNGLSRQLRFNSSAGASVDVALGRDNITTGCLRVTDGSQINYGGLYVGSGFGIGWRSNTTVNYNMDQALIVGGWADNTDATRKGNLTLKVYETTTAQTGLRLEAGPSAAKIGFLGATPAAQQTGGAATASGTYGTTEQGMLNKVYNAMRTFGLLS